MNQTPCPSCGCVYAPDQTEGLCPRCLAAMAVHPTDPRDGVSPLNPGQLFHGLRVEALIAQGGMGVVYRARKPGSDRDVALKILPPSLAAEEEFRVRFDQEARALAGLAHPNIVRLLDYGVEQNLMFLVMEFVDGVSLRQQLREGKLSPPQALAVALELCQALEFAHRERVIHRDVKPDNVLIDSSGRIKLTDFGLAIRIDAETARVTQTNFAVGTPHYMAPEQLERPWDIDQRVDIYSMGVVLYEMLTRELPLGRFPAPSSRAAVDPAFDEIVCRCLEKDPASRYGTISELRRALSGLPGGPRPAVAPPQPERPKISSNLEIRCPCGWRFYIPAGAVAGVHCPSCGERVPLQPADPHPTPPSAPPAPGDRRALIQLGIAGSILVVLAGLLLALALSSGPTRRTDFSPEIAASPPPGGPQAPTTPPRSETGRPSPTGMARPRPLPPPAELRLKLESLVLQANMTGLVATILLNSGRPQEHDQLQQRLATLDQDVRDALQELTDQGIAAKAPDRVQFGDRLLSFAGKRMEPAHSLAFADDLRAWLRAFRPGCSGEILVSRKKQMLSFLARFPERTPELVALAHQAGVTLGKTPGYSPAPAEPKPPASTPIRPSTLEGLRSRLAALPKGYQDLIPVDDRGRAEALLLAGQGSGDDIVFLNGRLTSLLLRAEDEQKHIALRIRDLEAKIAESDAPTDAVLCLDGRRVEGQILEESDSQVKVKARFGAVTIRREEIARIEKGSGSAAEFRSGYDAAHGHKTEILRLLAFAKERKLAPQLELAALTLVLQDPSDERARADAALPRSPFGTVAERGPAVPTGRIDYLGRSFTPEEFRQELKSLGYVLINGVWCEKVSKSLKIDNLYRDEARLSTLLRGASVQSQTHTERDTAYDFQTKSWVPRTKKVADGRYVGIGTCFIEIAAPGDLVEARVHARSQVSKVGGSVLVSVVLDPAEVPGKPLFTLSGPGENDGSFDATEKVAGRNRFFVRAQVSGSGMFLISDSNDLGVFEVKYVYGRPLERINTLLAGSAAGSDAPPALELRSANDVAEATCRTAAAASSRLETLVDSLADVRRRTETLLYTRDYSLPDRYLEVGTQLRDPLEPDWNSMSRDQALGLGTWWGRLPAEDRREFLMSYGLWCARCRYLRAPK